MARPRAEDYLEKQQQILEQAAKMFARKGFAGTSIAAIAEECGASKALIYHYYQSKESILFDMLDTHCELLLATAQAMRSGDTGTAGNTSKDTSDAEARLRDLLRSFMEIYVGSRDKHVVMLNDLHWLPELQQKEIREKERKVVEIFKELVRGVRPDLSAKTVTAMTMSLMGSINWTYIWFKEDGALTPQKFADITAELFFTGIGTVGEKVAGEKVAGERAAGERAGARNGLGKSAATPKKA
ncbi:MAG: TetR/AcrR family transcriptional regulator [Cyanobacteria bacterium REEB67]|nr:TetR/AcrR family transcriptional regulator [Cyanobacteria bacterium REEB67]